MIDSTVETLSRYGLFHRTKLICAVPTWKLSCHRLTVKCCFLLFQSKSLDTKMSSSGDGYASPDGGSCGPSSSA